MKENILGKFKMDAIKIFENEGFQNDFLKNNENIKLRLYQNKYIKENKNKY
ncbi:hypothetical protein [Caldiplasma sukawensis]